MNHGAEAAMPDVVHRVNAGVVAVLPAVVDVIDGDKDEFRQVFISAAKIRKIIIQNADLIPHFCHFSDLFPLTNYTVPINSTD